MRSSAKRKRVGRPRASQRRPVLAARVPEEFLERIQTSARASGRNASEELIWQAQQGYKLAQAHATAAAVVAHANKVAAELMKATLELKLREAGYSRVRDTNGRSMWIESGAQPLQLFNDDTRALLQEMLDQAALRAVKEMKEV